MPGASGARSRSCHPVPVPTEDTGNRSGASAIKQIIVWPFASSLPGAASPHTLSLSSLDS